MRKQPQRNAAPPNEAALHEAALAHLARYAATEAGLRRVLDRRVDRWARSAGAEGDPDTIAAQAATARQAVRTVVARLAASGVVSDAAFAESRARSLTRAGRSRQAVAAHLAAKGVDRALALAAVPDDPDTQLAAALALARRRRIGPFRPGDPPDQDGRRRELAVMARAGFPQPVASRALAMEPETADALVAALRRG